MVLVKKLMIRIWILKLVIMLEYQNIIFFLQKVSLQVGLKTFLWLKELKLLCHGHIYSGNSYYSCFSWKKQISSTSFLRRMLKQIIKTLCYDRNGVSEGIDVNKIYTSKECDVCHYWNFLKYGFKFQPNVCSRCHDL